MKKTISLFLLLLLLMSFCCAGSAENISVLPRSAVIGIAWRADPDSEFFTNVTRSIEAAGGTWVMLEQVVSPDLARGSDGHLTDSVSETGALTPEAGKLIRCNTWYGSNAAEAVGNVGLVIFTGGEDISPSLYYRPAEWHGIEAERDYSAERDVSDYLTMAYCLDHDIPVLGFCRGMQMLGVISGAEVIQDIPAWFEEQDIDYGFLHRNNPEVPGTYRDYAPHSVTVAPDSLLFSLTETEILGGCPSWHHQALGSTDNTRLTVTGYTAADGVRMIEAVERTDKTFALGLQFHPEAALVKHLDSADNRDSFMDYETALSLFERVVRFVEGVEEDLPAGSMVR